ncbi:MAG: leucine-rich repeat domain-containing protein, partial [Eubacterium sp.]|nr:leucine-rich repeat domain-containing protein [Eubacterium sp.]
MRKLALVMAMAVALTSVNTGALNAINHTYTVSAAQKNTLFGKTIKDNNVEYQLKDGVLTVSGTGIADNSYRTKYKVNNIKKVVIKSGITAIADNAFAKLKNLKKITIPNTVKQLGLSSMSGLNLDKITLPNSVEEIGRDCMRGGKCNSVTMPGNFKVRFNVNDPGGEEEEDPCREMYEILPKTNHVYLTSAFNPILKSYYCEAKKVHTWKKDSKYKTYGDNIYTKNGKTLVFVPAGTKHLKVRKGCKKVLLNSFCYNYEPEDWYEYFCTKLKTIEFPSSLKQIEGSVHGSEPFHSCTLKFQKKKLSGTILETLLEHGKVEFFSKKYGVKTVKGMKVSYDNVLLKGPSNKKSVIVPKGVKRIFKYAFLKDFNANCSNTKLKKITLPSSMKEINSKAFAYTRKLESVKIPNSVTVIGSSAFSGCNLKTIKLPKKLKKIGNGAFSSTKITNVTIPKSVTKIGDYCFSSTMKLNKLVMNCKMNTIPASIAFGSSVKEVVLPQNITKINESAFEECEKLESITLPEKVITIGANA